MSFTVGGVDVAAVHVGPTAAEAVYLGAKKVWPTKPKTPPPDAILSYNPVHYWPLDDANGNMADAVGSTDLIVYGTFVYRKQLTGFVGVKATPGRAVASGVPQPASVTYLFYVEDVEPSIGSSAYGHMGAWSTPHTMLIRRALQADSISSVQVYLSPPSGQVGGTIGPAVDWSQGVLMAVTADASNYSVHLRGHDGTTYDSGDLSHGGTQWYAGTPADVALFTRDPHLSNNSGYSMAHAAIFDHRLSPLDLDDIWASF